MMYCRTCQSDKPAEAFYASSRSRCKECIKESSRAHRAANLEHYRQYDRLRASQPHRVAARTAYSETDAGKAAHQQAKDPLCREATWRTASARYASENAGSRDGETPRRSDRAEQRAP